MIANLELYNLENKDPHVVVYKR